MSDTRLWTKDFLLSGLINFLMIMVFYMLVVVMASYAIHILNASTAQAGLVSGLFIIGTLVGRFFLHLIIQKIGQKNTMYLGFIGFCGSAMLYYLNPTLDWLMFIRFIHGLSYGFASTVISTMIAQIIPITRRGEGIGYFSLSNTVGTAIGPLLAIYLSIHASFDSIFIFCIVTSVICFMLSFYLSFPTQSNHTSIQTASWLSQMIELKAIPISIVALLSAICYSGVLTFINFYAQQLRLDYAGSLFFVIYSLSIFLSRPFTGKLMDQKGENIVMYPALVTLALSLLLLSFTQSSTVLLLCAALLGFGFGNIQSIAQTIAIQSTDIEHIGLATSTFLIAINIGLGFGPFFLGCLLNYMDYAQMYLYSGIGAALCLFLYYFLHGRYVKPLN
ncbi:MFS transporter [Acinetobacter qingfengensis]|uniref:Multidrug MFS transporter n=1 Tax=Acinetobacter qingfengensis TaxID=1262585 RepID=A0A1E7REE6_9GAMM|nr:MFS transporter [Acinetobacter qingfengensis]KAA8734745.1 MFS transporter [Acinetobacter qingfengensis]OEY97663.1 multidrug MFS transporter [Acinetobacter qingfengensis]